MIDGRTRVVGILGNPIEETLSPALHNAAFDHLALNWRYLPFLVQAAGLGEAVRAIRALNMAGVNVTMPFKEDVIEFLDEVDVVGEAVASVNTIVNHGGVLKGHNTDAAGFVRALIEDGDRDVAGGRGLIMGAGGAARAVAYGLAEAGAEALTIVNRTGDQAERAVGLLKGRFPALETEAASANGLDLGAGDIDIVVNATPLGKEDLKGIPSSVMEAISNKSVVVDLTTTPAVTAFLKAAVARGAKVVGGRSMLVFQGALAFALWTGREAPIDVMRKAIEDA